MKEGVKKEMWLAGVTAMVMMFWLLFLSGVSVLTVHAETTKDTDGRVIVNAGTKDALEDILNNPGSYEANKKIHIDITDDMTIKEFNIQGDVDILIDLNGHKITQEKGSYIGTIAAQGASPKVILENGSLYCKEGYAIKIYSQNSCRANVTIRKMTLVHMDEEPASTSRLVSGYSGDMQLLIEDCDIFNPYGYGVVVPGAGYNGGNSWTIIRNCNIVTGNAGLQIGADKAETSKTVTISNTSIQNRKGSDGLVIYKGASLNLSDGESVYANGVKKTVSGTIDGEFRCGILQIGAESRFHAVTLEATENSRCRVIRNINGGRFMEGKPLYLYASTTDEKQNFAGFTMGDGTTDVFYNWAGTKTNKEEQSYMIMPTTDVVVKAVYNAPGVISIFKAEGLVWPTTENTVKSVKEGIKLSNDTETLYKLFGCGIYPGKTYLEGKGVIGIADAEKFLMKDTAHFTYGKTYYLLLMFTYDSKNVTLGDGYSAEINGYTLTNNGDEINGGMGYATFLLPLQVQWCGATIEDTVTWYFDSETGNLKLEGKGALADFSKEEVPWKSQLEAITSVTVGKDVTGLTMDQIMQIPHLKEITVENGNSEYQTIDGVLYRIKDGVPYALCYMPETVDSCTIPDTVAVIEANSCHSTQIKNLVLGKNVQSIGKGAFAGCTELESIEIKNRDCVVYDDKTTIPSKAKMIVIAGAKAATYADKYNRKKELGGEIGAAVEDAIEWTYDPAAKILTVSGSGTMVDFRLAAEILWYQNEITTTCEKIVIGDGIRNVGDKAFQDMETVKEVQLGKDICKIGKMAFSGTTIEHLVLPSGVEDIGNQAFTGYNMKSISVASGNTHYKVQNGALYTMDGETLILYAGSSPASEFVVPEGVTKIEDIAFLFAKNLRTIKLPESLKELGVYALAGSGITELTVPAGVKKIEEGAFVGTENIKKLTLLNPDVETDGSAFMMGDGTEAYDFSTITIVCHESSLYYRLKAIGFNMERTHYYKPFRQEPTTEAAGKTCDKYWYCNDEINITVLPKLTSPANNTDQNMALVPAGSNGIIKGTDGRYYYVVKGKIQKTKSGLIKVGKKTYYIKKGVWQNKKTDFVKSGKKSYYVKKGVKSTTTGFVKVGKKTYYIKKGVKSAATGFVKVGKKTYYIKKGVKSAKSGLVKVGKKTYYIKKGIWQKTYTGKITYKKHTYAVKKGIQTKKIK